MMAVCFLPVKIGYVERDMFHVLLSCGYICLLGERDNDNSQ